MNFGFNVLQRSCIWFVAWFST